MNKHLLLTWTLLASLSLSIYAAEKDPFDSDREPITDGEKTADSMAEEEIAALFGVNPFTSYQLNQSSNPSRNGKRKYRKKSDRSADTTPLPGENRPMLSPKRAASAKLAEKGAFASPLKRATSASPFKRAASANPFKTEAEDDEEKAIATPKPVHLSAPEAFKQYREQCPHSSCESSEESKEKFEINKKPRKLFDGK